MRRRARHLLATAAMIAPALSLSACGGAGQTAPSPIAAPAPAPAPTPAPTPTPTPSPTGSFNTAEYRRSDGVSYHAAATVWATGASGSGVTVAVIDSGVDSDSTEFAGRIHSMSADVAGGARGFDDADSDGHGTNVAQLLLGARNDLGTVGIAYNATLLALRADRPGSCNDPTVTNPDEQGCRFSDTAIAAGVDRAVSAGARVINISLGGSAPDANLRAAIGRATAAGIVIIVSAGNDGDSTDPALDPANPDPFAQGLQQAGNGLVIIAGSNDVNSRSSAFSNRAGNSANSYLLALGEDVCCEYANGDLKREVRPDGTFVFLISGTSFAAPQIAGAAALLAQAFPRLTGQQIVTLLLTTATDVGATDVDPVNGHGILNLARAFAPQGATLLAGTTASLPLDRAAGGLSGAMGDAALREGGDAIVLDAYQRAYAIPLNRLLAGGGTMPTLTAALSGQVRSVSAGNATTAVSLTVLPGHAAALPLSLSGQDADRARTIAGSIITRLSPSASVGFAVERGSDGLLATMRGRPGHAFLIADDADSTRLLRAHGSAGTVARFRLANGLALTLAAEQGDTAAFLPQQRLAQPSLLDRRSRYARMAAGLDGSRWTGDAAWRYSLTTSLMQEGDSLLGARLSHTLGSLHGRTLFVDATTDIALTSGWSASAQWREGWTAIGGGGLASSGGTLRSRAFAFDVARRGVFASGDSLSLRLAQPLRVESGGLRLSVPTGYDYATLGVSYGSLLMPLAPIGRETVVEAAWTAPIMGGKLSLNGYWRNQPGHMAAAPDDLGAAIRFALGF